MGKSLPRITFDQQKSSILIHLTKVMFMSQTMFKNYVQSH